MTAAQRDGFSTGGSAGQGLGAMRRMASVFDIFSQPERGTVVMARIYAKKRTPPEQRMGALAIPKPGEIECGDTVGWEFGGSKSWFIVADGLGHGPSAAEASALAVAEFDRNAGEPAVSRLERIHEALRGSRGAAVSITEITNGSTELVHAGLGNISAVAVTDRARNLISLHGTAGQDSPRINPFTSPWNDSGTLILHSDGLTARWDISNYPGLLSRHPSIIAAVLYRDAARGRDDAIILVYKAPR
jgi:serine/threonine protein phosphatase PrpC